jgi:hypothetical protein
MKTIRALILSPTDSSFSRIKDTVNRILIEEFGGQHKNSEEFGGQHKNSGDSILVRPGKVV